MKAIALFFVLPCFIAGYHGLRLAPAWVGAVPEVPQGPEEVLSLETLERNDLVWNRNHEYEEQLRAQRTRTLEHERKAASSGSASSSSKASKQQVREQEEALSKRERRVAKMQLAVPGDEDSDAEIVPNAEAEAEFLPDNDHDDAMGDAWNRRNGFD